ncbi:MAG: Gfo/Idh/MocA family oxidoreductase [Dysgonamonadaceae bacterium]|jgi:predicted dehydrogenase|nr:Gfo/Idh/MocA family oxidoreductase [Dysgonamonadaceae bacterium]
MKNTHASFSRRDFIKTSAATTAGMLFVVPSHTVSGLGHIAPSDKLNIAGIGIGGKGSVNLNNMNSQNIVALCDIDWQYAKPVFDKYPNAKRYKDFRKMLDEYCNSIDAVVIATPDHTHAVSAVAAMQLGKHVYVQKPLTHSVYESRVLLETSRRYKVVTQMGNEGHSNAEVAEVCEWIWSGAIGEVTHVDAWTDRPIWPQGLTCPELGMWVPEHIDWDLFIGPAKMRPYHRAYHPWDWRGWWDFGTGALGDMACHVLDVVFSAMKLGHPTAVEASSTAINTESAPVASMIKYEFPARPKEGKLNMPALSVTWYDGGLFPQRPAAIPDDVELGQGRNGIIFHGTKGVLMCGSYGGKYKMYPEEKFRNLQRPTARLRRVNTSHEMDFVRACKESPDSRVMPLSNFEYAGPLNEMVVMGNLAIRLKSLNKKLLWDGEAMRITNLADNEELKVTNGVPKAEPRTLTLNARQTAEEYVRHTYREGWSL